MAETTLTAAEFTRQLQTFQSDDELRKIQRYFKSDEQRPLHRRPHAARLHPGQDVHRPATGRDREATGFTDPRGAGRRAEHHEQAGGPQEHPGRRRTELFELYLRRHDRIDNWDLVDLAAPNVIGDYLLGRPRDILYDLARSANPWERRTAIYSTLAFVRKGDVTDTFGIARILVDDPHDLVQKPTGGMLREAGKKDEPALLAFLDNHAATMPRTMLRYAVERLDPEQRTST